MTDYQLVDKKTHKNTKVATRFTKELGYGVGAVMVLNTEIAAAQKEYAIIFRKHPETGRFFPNLLLGFSGEENLFIDDSGHWNAAHIPLAIAKGPFLIGFQDVDGQKQMSACLDMDDPRVSDNVEGEALFLEDGALSPYMNHISQILLLLHDASKSVTQMVDLFVELDLIEPLNLDVQLKNGEQLGFQGGYTIAEEKLEELDVSALQKLHSSGFLPLAYYIAGSIVNVRKLIEIKNKALNLQ